MGEEISDSDDEAGGTKPALHGSGFEEGILHRM
jgi:hypothetical protein